MYGAIPNISSIALPTITALALPVPPKDLSQQTQATTMEPPYPPLPLPLPTNQDWCDATARDLDLSLVIKALQGRKVNLNLLEEPAYAKAIATKHLTYENGIVFCYKVSSHKQLQQL